jgi:acyl phosphate:glycerol-3-phosphate acyltransferase
MLMMAEYSLITIFTLFIGGYVIGSIPFGLVLCRLAGHGDIREIGSGNIGATNVLRTGNKPLAFLTLLLDIGKGAIAVLIVEQFYPGLGLYAGGGAFLGHVYSIFLKFKGGKGVATFIGLILALSPTVGIACIATWLVSAATFRVSSLSAMIATTLCPLYSYFYSGINLVVLTSILSILILFKHRENIKRLLDGTEPKIGRK